MKNGKWTAKKSSIMLFSCILSMFLLFCVILSSTYAWLLHEIPKTNTGTTNLGAIGVDSTQKSFSNTQTFTMPSSGYLNVSNNTKIKNTGSLNALLRVFYSVEVAELLNEDSSTTKVIATTKDLTEVEINSDFLASDENIQNVFSGYYFYNKLLAPGETVTFIDNEIKPQSDLRGKQVKLNLFYELFNYEGGAYQLNQQIPWKNAPASWFLNFNALIKTSGSLLTPKFDIKFSETSKIELTAKTFDSTNHILFGRKSVGDNSCWIGIDGAGRWTGSKLLNFSYPSTYSSASTFANGKFNTITFSWTGVSAGTDDHIRLVWDASWSKEIAYKRIRIWNKSGQVVYDCIPQTDGTFLNSVTGQTMPMYKFNINTLNLESSAEKYTYTTRVVYSNDCDYSSYDGIPSNQYGMDWTYSTAHTISGQSLEMWSEYDYGNTSMDDTEARIKVPIEFEAGYSYTVSLWIKSTAPDGALAYRYDGTNFMANIPGLEIEYSSSGSIKRNVYSCQNWTLVTATTPVIESNYSGSAYYIIPSGASYRTYMEDVFVIKNAQ